MSDEIFIKNSEDYNEYRQQKPWYKFERKNVRFICSRCNRESTKSFRNLTPDFICTDCQKKLSRNSEEAKQKYRNTCIERYGTDNPSKSAAIKQKKEDTCRRHYGVDNPAQSTAVQEKMKSTNMVRYGVENVSSSSIIREKVKTTLLERYGVENVSHLDSVKYKKKETCRMHFGSDYPQQSDMVRQKSKNTMNIKYGAPSPQQVPEIREKTYETNMARYGTAYTIANPDIYAKGRQTKYNNTVSSLKKMLAPYDLDFISNDSINFNLRCLKCGKEFSFSRSYFYVLLNTQTSCFCPHCSRVRHNDYSFMEKEVVDCVKSIYPGEVRENDRMALGGRELDIFLPDIRLGIEFDGTYWHADPRFFDEDDIVVNCPAIEIWERDREKDILCESAGIMLYRVKEYDWCNERDRIMTELKIIIDSVVPELT